MDWLIGLFKNKLFSELLAFILYGSGIFAFLKISIWIYSQRIFSFYWMYKHKKRFYTHKLFDLIDSFQSYKKDVATGVLDPVKKEIVSDLFHLELAKMKQIVKSNLDKLFKSNFKEYINSFPKFDMENIINDFYYDYMESREALEIKARLKFTKLGMSQEDFNRLWGLYEEIFQDYLIILLESFNKYRSHKDIYRATFFLLDDYYMLIEIIYKSLPHKFNRLNGRSYGIQYKGGKIGDGIK